MLENQHDTIHDTILSFGFLQKNLHETTASARRRSASSKAKAKAAKPVACYLKTWTISLENLNMGAVVNNNVDHMW